MRNANDFAPFQRIVLGYLLVSLLWILLSDQAVDVLLPHDLQHTAQTWKGWLFVAVTTGLLYGLLRRVHRQMIEVAARELEAAQAQVRSATLLETVINSSGDVIVAKDRQGRYTLFNAEAERLVGKRSRDVLGMDDHAVFPAQAAAIKAIDRKVMESGERVNNEETLSTVDGPAVFHVLKGPLRDQDSVFGVYAVARNVTENVRMREALQASEYRYRQMFEASPLAMWVHDAHTLRFLDVNPAAVRQYGYARERLLGMTLHELQPSAELAALHLLFHDGSQQPVADAEAVVNRFHRCQDGHVIEVEFSSSAIEFDGRSAYLVLAVDVSARNRLQRERDASHRKLADVLSRVTDAFVAIDRSQRLTYLNERAAQWFAPGVPVQALLGRLAWDLVPEAVGTVFQDAVQKALDTGQPTVAEDWFAPWQRWMELRMYPSTLGATAYFTDVTVRRNSEEALKQSQRELSDLSHRLLHQEQVMQQNLAQSLHDRLGQQLSSARLYLDVMNAQVDASLRGQRWSDDVEYAFFMIAREAIANALRHAQARHLTVQLQGGDRRLHLLVRDDGLGLPEAELTGRPGHLGLVGMRERALAVGAGLTVASSPEGGTTVEVTLDPDPVSVATGAAA